jgi:tetratricopeptide (TPR) repeat protein
LEFHVKYNPFLWFRGLCQPGERLSVAKMIFYTAMGPLVSLLITVTCFILIKTTGPDERQTVVLTTVMVIGGIFTLSSAIPRGRLPTTHSGGDVRNDAAQIVQLWKTRNLPSGYWEVWDKYRAKDYTAASDLSEKLIDGDGMNIALYRQGVVVHLQSGRYERAEMLIELIRSRYRFSLEDEINDGCHKILVGRYRHAVAIYTELVGLHYNHFLILNNLGYALVAAGEPGKAMLYLDRGITLVPQYAELYASRAWAKMEMGQWEEGLADAQHALELDESSADAHRTVGLYALEKGRLEEAREHFLKARSIDPRVQFVDEHLVDIERRLAC